ncbi:hypothetical protein ACIBG8_03435 [Nonomuraea sp. NPDC050556]|uniref:hypothetical protein n=1 Tax=Nonomuraea sp. NPDC050556 TaxID=3364369 RepID=UPI0037ADEE84
MSIVMVVVGISVGCSGSAVEPSPSPVPSTATGAGQGISRSEAVGELQAFLDRWRTDGLVVASREYLVADEQVVDGADALVLKAARIAKVRSASPTADGIVLDVDLDLEFQGATGAWRNGVNERFVTFTPRAGAVPFVMSLATSP